MPCPLLVIVAASYAALFIALTVGFALVLTTTGGGDGDDDNDGDDDDDDDDDKDDDSGGGGAFSPESIGSAAFALYLVLVMVVMVLPGCAFASALRRFMASRLDLEQQLAAFSVKRAGCSDDRDRARVERSIALWWASPATPDKDVGNGGGDGDGVIGPAQ